MKKIILGTLAIGLMGITGCDSSNDELKKLEFTWKDVTNPVTGKTWMDRNLGASRVATNSLDENAFGELYQWGRGSDGHQCRNSDTTSVLSQGDNPGHGDFIVIGDNDQVYDWRNPKNDSLWQGVDGINNPCPTGYRLPTRTEWEEEVDTWTSRDHNGAFGSILKLPLAGSRLNRNGLLFLVGNSGLYWSSTVIGSNARHLHFYSNYASMSTDLRADGYSVRCLKD